MKRFLAFKILAFSAILLCITVFAENIHNPFLGMTNFSFFKDSPPNDYQKQWKTVDSLENARLTAKANTKVGEIYGLAKADKNTPQIIKALIYKLKFKNTLEEDSETNFIEDINKELKETDNAALRALLYSVKAELIWNIYTQNRWVINQRTATDDVTENIKTWPASRYMDEARLAYIKSLELDQQSKQLPISDFEAILNSNETFRVYRPTLFHFLAHRALNHFLDGNTNLNKPVYAFELDDQNMFAPAEKFVNLVFETQDSVSDKYFAISIYREIIAYDLKNGNSAALLDADLLRLKYVYNNFVGVDKEIHYLAALVALEKLYKGKKEEPAVLMAQADFFREQSNSYQVNQGDVPKKYAAKKSVDLANLIIKNYPDSYYKPLAVNLINEIIQKNIEFTAEATYSPDRENLFLLKFKNLNNAYFKVVSVDYEKYRTNKDEMETDTFNQWLNGLEAVKSFSQKLPNDGLFHSHTAEVILPALKKGFYVLVGGSSPDNQKEEISHYTSFFVSNLTYLAKTENKGAKLELVILDRNTGKTVSDAEVIVFKKEYNYTFRRYQDNILGKYKSDKNGRILHNGEGNYLVRIKTKDDFYSSEDYNYVYKRYDSKPNKTTAFFTDRGIYRPGQTIYFKGIKVLSDKNKNELVTNTKTMVTLYDANYQKVTDITVEVNDFGSFQGSFVIPQGLATGSFTLSEVNGSKSVRVEEYKRPKFEVTIKKPTDVFRVNDFITVTGNAKALAGYNITNAKVQYRVYRVANYPWWYRYWYSVNSEEQEIVYGKTVTDDKGEFSIRFQALLDKSVSEESEATFNYRISVEVTDEAGETRTSTDNISAGYKTIVLSASIPELMDIDDIKPWNINVQNLNGQVQKQDVTITIEKIKKSGIAYRKKLWEKPDLHVIDQTIYKSKFPSDEYKNESSILDAEAEKIVYSGTYNTNDSVGFIQPLAKLLSGKYRVTITAKDPFGKEVKTIHSVTLYGGKEKTSPIENSFFVLPINSTVEPGSEAKFYISSLNNVTVFYEIEGKNGIIKEEAILLKNEQKIINIPIIESYRGNITVRFSAVYEGRSYLYSYVVTVPFTNKQLNIKLQTFRDKMLPGSNEEWKLNVSPVLGEKETAELLLGMYDASLDAFVANNWYFDVWKSNYVNSSWKSPIQKTANSSQLSKYYNTYKQIIPKEYESLNWFGMQFWNIYNGGYRNSHVLYETAVATPGISVQKSSRTNIAADNIAGNSVFNEEKEISDLVLSDKSEVVNILPIPEVKARSNFNETAFFFPQLKTDKDGNVIFSFTMPESLTKWKFMGLAHTKSLQIGSITGEMVTQKELMVNTFAPRFLREGDELYFSGKITNLTDKVLEGTVVLELSDPVNDANLAGEFALNTPKLSFSVKPGESVPAEWKIKIPFKRNLVKYSIKAISGTFSDGEENVLPILTNRMLVTETVSLWVNGNETKKFDLPKMNMPSSTLVTHKVSLEFTSNPAWYAIQSLPYLMEYPYECAEQTFSRLYANSIASHIANSDPKIKAVFDIWKNYQPDALQSKLEQNEDLKNILLEETPWVRQAKNESERKRRVALLFDLNRMVAERKSTLKKLEDMQTPNGGFPWFKGGRDDRYITQYIVSGFGKLGKLGVSEYNYEKSVMIKSAIAYLDARIADDYATLIKNKADLSKDNIGSTQIHYLYMRSYFSKVSVSSGASTAVNYYAEQSEKYWNKKDDYSMGMLALVFHRSAKKELANRVVTSLKDRSITNEELGMYWKGMLQGGYYWYNAPIETMALYIESFSEITPNDKASIDNMRKWLLKNKQTNDWKTTRATTEASYALFLGNTKMLSDDALVEIAFGEKAEVPFINPEKTEAGTGYFKVDFYGKDIKKEMANITVSKKTEGAGWGAMYWQYFEDLDKITKPTTPNPLSVSKKLFREVKTDRGLVLEEITDKTKLETGDRIITRIVLTSDRPMEYVHLKDMRASGLEPENVLSTYKYQAGLGYYESTRDVATHFFISYVPRGTYVFEYPSRVTHKGNFSNGITQIQCMYAPEFTFHSDGIRINTN